MITVSVCNPDASEPFPQFIHNTTTYVGVPHGSRSQLWITLNERRYLTLEAEGESLIEDLPISSPGQSILLSQFKQPLKPSGFLPQFLRRGRAAPSAPMRLYAFRAVLSRRPLSQGGSPDATFDFHILCNVDYQWAHAFHLKLLQIPDAIAPATISDMAEGTCPICAVVRARLQKDWTQE